MLIEMLLASGPDGVTRADADREVGDPAACASGELALGRGDLPCTRRRLRRMDLL